MKNYMKQWVYKVLLCKYLTFALVENQCKHRISWSSKTHTTKFPYGETSSAILFYGEISVRQNIRTAKFPTAKFPYGEISLRRIFLTAKFLYGDISYDEISKRPLRASLRSIIFGKHREREGKSTIFNQNTNMFAWKGVLFFPCRSARTSAFDLWPPFQGNRCECVEPSFFDCKRARRHPSEKKKTCDVLFISLYSLKHLITTGL